MPPRRIALRFRDALERFMARRSRSTSGVDVIWSAYCAARMWALVAYETPVVFRLVARMKAGLLPADHPWMTGAVAGDHATVWERNLVYRSPSSRAGSNDKSDLHVVEGVGRFLARMVQKSVPAAPEIPHGKKRRMPHAVNYLHGAVHYNGMYLLFDDFADLISHLTCVRFRRELIAFAHAEQREVTFVFRERNYDPLDYAYCIGAVRNLLPWFSNGNGPTKKPVLWGNVSPFPAIGTINGAWLSDTRKLHRGDTTSIVRPPVLQSPFAGDYTGTRCTPNALDRFVAWCISVDVRLHGFGGQIAFTQRDVIEPERRAEYKAAGGYLKWSASYDVPHPFRRQHRDERDAGVNTSADNISIIIPVLNEEDRLAACLDAVAREFPGAECIVVDGGSDDASVSLAHQRGALVVHSKRGRGLQCARGAERATRRWLLFLHADAILQPGCGDAVRAGGDTLRAATFRLEYPSKGLPYRMVGWTSRVDSYFTSYGDQGILLRRDLYEAVGGIPEVKLFEDVELLRRVRRVARIQKLPASVSVSVRRYQSAGVKRQLVLNLALMCGYRAGLDEHALERLYEWPKRRRARA